jgi:hypothetical protein
VTVTGVAELTGEVVRAGGPGDSADYIGGMYVMEFRGA